MNYILWIGICIIILGIAGIFGAYKYLKWKQEVTRKERDIPKEVLNKFDEAEHAMKGGIDEHGQTKSPYEILWKIARENSGRRYEGTDESIRTSEPESSSGELYEQSVGRQDIQIRTSSSTIKDKPIIGKPKPNGFRRLISRARRSTR